MQKPNEFFLGKKIVEIWPARKRVVTLRSSETVASCLKTLDEHNILSAPVLDDQGGLLGIIDILDISLFVLGIYPKDIKLDVKITEAEVREILNTGKRFESTKIAEVIELSETFKSDYQHTFVVDPKEELSKVLEMFSKGVHRVLVADGASIENYISQQDLLSVVAQCLPLMENSVMKKKIGDLGISTGNLGTVRGDESLIGVLLKMNNYKGPMFSAVPVVDDKGTLVANFSTSNLKRLKKGEFGELLLGCLEYLGLQTFKHKPFLSGLASLKALHPITITNESTLEEAVLKLLGYKIHRLWLVDSENKPIGVISIGDIFKVFLPWFTSEEHQQQKS